MILVSSLCRRGYVENVKERVVRDLLICTPSNKWMCRKCQVTFMSPLRVRRHIIAKHFQGPMCHCKYCGKYSRNEVALGKHMAKKHRLEKEKELSQWQITKRMAKAAFKEPPPTPRTKPGNKKNAHAPPRKDMKPPAVPYTLTGSSQKLVSQHGA